jgi:hypothetical protein
MKTIRNILFSGIFTVLTAMAFGQYNGANARLEKNSIQIGDQIKMELLLTVPAGSRVQWPMLLDTLAPNIEILRKTDIDTVESNELQFTLKQEMVITSFDSGYFEIKPIRFRYNQKGDTVTYFMETSSEWLTVQTIQTDPAQDIKPIKPPLKAPVTFKEVMPWIGLALLVIAIAVAVFYFLKKRKQRKPVVTTRLNASIPPYEAAIEALDSLKNKKLWQSGRVKEYYSELTEIVREYIELRFTVRALEMTTSEIGEAMRLTEVSQSSREKLVQTLTLADLVKFAKEQPMPVENELSINQCFEFVRETRPPKDTAPVTAPSGENVEQKNV